MFNKDFLGPILLQLAIDKLYKTAQQGVSTFPLTATVGSKLLTLKIVFTLPFSGFPGSDQVKTLMRWKHFFLQPFHTAVMFLDLSKIVAPEPDAHNTADRHQQALLVAEVFKHDDCVQNSSSSVLHLTHIHLFRIC